MSTPFAELAGRARARWNNEALEAYDTAAAAFRAELDARTALGAQLRAARTALHLTQPALAKLTGLQQAEISRIETGGGNPTAETLVRLASALDLHVALIPVHAKSATPRS